MSNLDQLLKEIVTAKTEKMTMWNVSIDAGEVCDPFNEPIKNTKDMLMCCYFNIGIEAAIGYNVERNRTKTKCCNKVLYCLNAARIGLFNLNAQTIKNRIMRVVSRPNQYN